MTTPEYQLLELRKQNAQYREELHSKRQIYDMVYNENARLKRLLAEACEHIRYANNETNMGICSEELQQWFAENCDMRQWYEVHKKENQNED